MSEIQMQFHKNLPETRGSWAVGMLYNYSTNTGLANRLRLLLIVKVGKMLDFICSDLRYYYAGAS